jgi:hypothetical protein
MHTRPHLARERQRGMLAQAHQRLIRQFRDLASAPALREPSPRGPGTHAPGRTRLRCAMTW